MPSHTDNSASRNIKEYGANLAVIAPSVFGFEVNLSPRIEAGKAYGQLAFEFMENLNFELTRGYANSNVSSNIRNMVMRPYNPTHIFISKRADVQRIFKQLVLWAAARGVIVTSRTPGELPRAEARGFGAG